jgi:alkylhydroperoxidase family enzyme
VEALSRDFRAVPLPAQDRVMLEYVEQITRDATRITPEHHVKLREVGFDDRGILQITLIASWFNYINRVADALGVGRDQASGMP